MVILVQNETDKFRAEMLAFQIIRQFAANVFAIRGFIGFKPIADVMGLDFKALYDKIIIALENSAIGDVFRLYGDGVVNLQLCCFFLFPRAGALFTFSFSADAIKTSDFRLFSYIMLTISAFSSACIVSVIRKGRIKEGLTQIPVFIVVAILIYTLASMMIAGMFQSFI